MHTFAALLVQLLLWQQAQSLNIVHNKTASAIVDGTIRRGVCGPDVTQNIRRAVEATQWWFGRQSDQVKEDHCDALDDLYTGYRAWDIYELYNTWWISQNMRPECATRGAKPACGETIQVGSQCYFAGSPNYVIYGVMMRLCYDHWCAKYPISCQINFGQTTRFTAEKVVTWINRYKGGFLDGQLDPRQWFSGRSGNYQQSMDWAKLGYSYGWPAASRFPPGDRSNCATTCSKPLPYRLNITKRQTKYFKVRWCTISNRRSAGTWIPS